MVQLPTCEGDIRISQNLMKTLKNHISWMDYPFLSKFWMFIAKKYSTFNEFIFFSEYSVLLRFLRRWPVCILCLVHICPGRRAINLSTIFYGHRAISSTGPWGQPGVNPYRDCAEIVRKSCNVSAVAVQSPQPLRGNRTEPVHGSAFARCPCGDCAMPPTTCLRATVLRFFQICKTSR